MWLIMSPEGHLTLIIVKSHSVINYHTVPHLCYPGNETERNAFIPKITIKTIKELA